jgi:hypothetical protein
VDRPLSAFGTLLTLLALSVFAVSSTSRSTTVQAPRPDSRKPASRYARGGSNFVLIVPADVPEGDDDMTADLGLDSNTNDVDMCTDQIAHGLCSDEVDQVAASARRQSRIVPARVEVVERTPETGRIPAPMDCQSHYDAVYDRAVYGAAAVDSTREARVVEQNSVVGDSEADDFLSIFRSLSASDRTIPSRRARLLRSKLGAYSAAACNWLRHWSAGLAADVTIANEMKAVASSGQIAWSDYAELMDRATRDAAATSSLPGSSDAARGVRSGHWLRHSAASSLYQLGLVLQSAAVQIRDHGDSAITTRTEAPAR